MGNSKTAESPKAREHEPFKAPRVRVEGRSPASESALLSQDRLGNAALLRLLHTGVIRPKLQVSDPGDVEEQEAERVAETLTSREAPPPTIHGIAPGAAQRACGSCTSGAPCEECEKPEPLALQRRASGSSLEGEEIPADPTRLVSDLGPGDPLDRSVRDLFEPRLGEDLSAVRVHTSGRAADAARRLHAHAFTVDRDIAFAPGRFAPETPQGTRLLAHELTHVVQQRGVGGASRTMFRQPEAVPAEAAGGPASARPYPPLYWGRLAPKWGIAPKADLVALPRSGATLEDLAEFLYGSRGAAADLASVNGLDVKATLRGGTPLRLTGQELTGVALGNLKASRLMPVGFGDPDVFLATKRILDASLEADFNFIVRQIDENLAFEVFGVHRNEAEILATLEKWGEEKFTEFPWAYPHGGDYLDRLFLKLINKTKILEGLFTDEWTNYYSLLFNHFDRLSELEAIRDRYSKVHRGHRGVEELSVASFLWEDIASGSMAERIAAFEIGLAKGAWSGLKGTAKFAHTLVTDPKRAISDLAKVPGALKSLWSHREELLDTFLNASPEKQAEMIGEFFGQIEFGIASSGAGSAAGQAISKLAKTPGMLGKAAKVADVTLKLPSKVLGGATKVVKTVVVGGVKFAAKGAMWAAKGVLKLAGKVLRGTWSVVEETLGAVTQKLYYFYDEAAGVLRKVDEGIAQLFVKCKSPCDLTQEAEELARRETTLGELPSDVRKMLGEGPEVEGIHITGKAGAGMAEKPLHHVLPQEERAFFAERGFRDELDIDEFTVELEAAHHQAIHGGGAWRLGRTWSGEWNRKIMDVLHEAEALLGRKLTAGEILRRVVENMKRYDIPVSFVSYTR